ncbi:MAG: hypothetical protein H0V87_05125 [Chloroflexi bacterium]|nr:hypothetical protein [Chloroflexota bacterium]
MDVPLLVAIVWWALLIVTVVVVVPILVRLLHRTYLAARTLEHNTARALAGGVGIAGNTANIAALTATIEVATDILGSSRAIEEHAGTIESALGSRAGG